MKWNENNCRARIPSMGHHTWPNVTSLSRYHLFQPIQSKNISDALRKTLDIVLGSLHEKDSYQEKRLEKDHHIEQHWLYLVCVTRSVWHWLYLVCVTSVWHWLYLVCVTRSVWHWLYLVCVTRSVWKVWWEEACGCAVRGVLYEEQSISCSSTNQLYPSCPWPIV